MKNTDTKTSEASHSSSSSNNTMKYETTERISYTDDEIVELAKFVKWNEVNTALRHGHKFENFNCPREAFTLACFHGPLESCRLLIENFIRHDIAVFSSLMSYFRAAHGRNDVTGLLVAYYGKWLDEGKTNTGIARGSGNEMHMLARDGPKYRTALSAFLVQPDGYKKLFEEDDEEKRVFDILYENLTYKMPSIEENGERHVLMGDV